ncbi:MAG: hypothetical protein WD077_03490 [Bacteroidia bacterium]
MASAFLLALAAPSKSPPFGETSFPLASTSPALLSFLGQRVVCVDLQVVLFGEVGHHHTATTGVCSCR